MCASSVAECATAHIHANGRAGLQSGTIKPMLFSEELPVSAEKLQQLLSELQKQGAVVTSDLRDALAVALGKLPLVSQHEFDTQVEILRRTREKLARVEAQVETLEQALADQEGKAPPAD